MKTYLVIDPGLVNFCFSLIQVRKEGAAQEVKARVMWHQIFDLSSKTKPNPDKDKAREALTVVSGELGRKIVEEELQVDKVLVEFQPPLATRANPALVRWNTWVEAYTVSFFHNTTTLPEIPVEYIHPSGMKRFFDISSGQHSVNKSLGLVKARSFIEGSVLRTDHEADCVLMAVFDFLKN